VEIFASSNLTDEAKHAKPLLFTRFFRIHAKTNEINFDISTPSVGIN